MAKHTDKPAAEVKNDDTDPKLADLILAHAQAVVANEQSHADFIRQETDAAVGRAQMAVDNHVRRITDKVADTFRGTPL